MAHVKRDPFNVEPTIRSMLVKRIIVYWCACLLFSALPMIIGTSLAEPNRWFVEHLGDLALRFWPVYLTAFGILPFIIRDALRVTNRTMGPLTRLKAELRRARDGGDYRSIQCREDDILRELVLLTNDAMEAAGYK